MSDVTHEPAKKAMGSIRQLSADEEAQRLAESRERGLLNWNWTIHAARREGLEHGRMEALRNTLTQLLKQRFGPLPEWAADDLAAASADQLTAWTGSVLSAGSLEELFGSPG